ncbi:MAG: cation diffusion facilitator family transporter [Promethearchaeota archaeon]|nr:MAG: cation diffusion facilitator family transporter [Candidatus Lokiarchaeota archaeon]
MDIRLKFGLYAFLVIIFQSAIKLFGVILTGSLSFLSETVDTLTDIVFVSITLYSLYISIKPADYQHMYGHSKMDAIGAIAQGIILVNIYVILIFNALQALLEGGLIIENADLGFQLLIVSFLVNLFFSRWLIWQGKKKNSLSLQIQGLNLFQDSLRAIVVIINFLIVIFFDFPFLDPIFSIILSIWIIISAIKIAIEGVKDVIDVNPIDAMILENLKMQIFNLEHVNGVMDLKVRSSGKTLFLEVHLSVEDHISIVHADEIIKAIRSMSTTYFPSFNVETIIEMNPLGGEASLSEHIINLLHSNMSEFEEIEEFKDLNVFRIEDSYFLSLTIIVDNDLTLEEAHAASSKLEHLLKKQVPLISRIITHIDSEIKIKKPDQIICEAVNNEDMAHIKKIVEKVLRMNPFVKGYHGLECWNALNRCILEIHVFFEGSLNIGDVHDYVTSLESQIRDQVKFFNLDDIILHSEPIKDRTNGVLF